MKTLISSFIIFAFTFLSLAQVENSNVQFGFGVNISREVPTFSTEDLELNTLPIDLANFSFVIRGENYRVEPSLGYYTISFDNSSGQYTSKGSMSNFRIGAVIAYNNSSFESMNFYYGINIGVILSSISTESTNPYETNTSDDSKTDFFVGPAVGGEYMFNRYFSLGGEVNLNYISLGHYGDGNTTTWLISTRGAVYVRWYVN